VRIGLTPYPGVEAIAFFELIKQSILSVLGKWYQQAIELKATGEMIGDCAIERL
jgi:hypothetical protein